MEMRRQAHETHRGLVMSPGVNQVDYTGGDSNFRFEITGLRAAVRAMENAGVEAKDLKDLMVGASTIVIRAAKPPVRTGRLRSTLRASKTKTSATVRIGGIRSVQYAPPIHWGWKDRNITPNPFMQRAKEQTEPRVLNYLLNGITKILKKEGLL